MTTEHYVLLGAVAVFVAALVYATWPRKAAAVAVLQSYAAPIQQFEAATVATLGSLVKTLDSQALDQGAAELERRIRSSLADGHISRLQAALAPKDQTPTAPPAAS